MKRGYQDDALAGEDAFAPTGGQAFHLGADAGDTRRSYEDHFQRTRAASRLVELSEGLKAVDLPTVAVARYREVDESEAGAEVLSRWIL